MKKSSKKWLKRFIIIMTLLFASYGGYKLYDYALEEITERVKQGVSKGIRETINPISWIKKLFKRHKDIE